MHRIEQVLQDFDSRIEIWIHIPMMLGVVSTPRYMSHKAAREEKLHSTPVLDSASTRRDRIEIGSARR
jgi:hypothetical protein